VEIIGVSKVHGNGRIHIPVEVRKKLNISDGDKIVFIRDITGKIFIIKSTDESIRYSITY